MTRPIRQRVKVLAAVMLGTMTLSGMFHEDAFVMATTGHGLPFWSWGTLGAALTYSVPMFGIILAHEGGHMWACRRHGLFYGGPYCLPLPFGLTGTFGALLRVGGPYPSRTALFDVAAAGPVCGFAASLVALVVGLWLSAPMNHAALASPIVRLWEPWLLKALQHLWWGPAVIGWHPVLIAGWVGLVFQMANLLPYGQFDGGHLVTALVGPVWARRVSWAVLVGVTGLAVTPSLTWIVCGMAMVASGVGGVVPIRSEPSLSRGRKWLAGGLAAVLASCWLLRP